MMSSQDTPLPLGAVKLISQDDTTATVGGYGVVFGGRDLEGDTFTPETDYKLDLLPAKLVYYDHSLGDVDHDIGRVFNDAIKTDDKGLWIEAQLDKSAAYVDEVLKLIEEGVLGWSSGSVAHLVRAQKSTITQWPIVEFSLTPTPAEPRTLGVERLKALAQVQPNLQAIVEPGTPPVDDDAEREPTKQADVNPLPTGEDMSEETQEVAEKQQPALTIEDVTQAVKAAVAPLQEEINTLKAMPAVDVGIAGKAVNIVDADSMGNSYEKAFHKYVKSRGKDKSFKALEAGVDSEGGYLVAEEWEPAIAKMRESVSAVRRLPVSRRSTMHPIYRWPTESTAYTAATSTTEEAAYNQTDPAFGEATFTIEKYTRLTLVSEELFDDSIVNIQAELSEMLGRAHGLAENSTLVTRLEAATLTSLTLDNAASITAAEIPELYYLLPDGYDFSGWLMRKATEGLIRGLTGNEFLFVPTPQGGVQGQLWGAPVVTASAVDAVATTNNSIFGGDWTAGVGFVERSGMSISINPYLYEANGQVGIFSRSRWDIQVLQGLAIVEGVQA